MNDGDDEATLAVEALVDDRGVGQKWLGVEAKVVAIEPIDEPERAIVGGSCLVVVDSVDKVPRIGNEGGTQRVVEVPSLPVIGWQLSGVPEEDVEAETVR